MEVGSRYLEVAAHIETARQPNCAQTPSEHVMDGVHEFSEQDDGRRG
jgi:hypothetical protein